MGSSQLISSRPGGRVFVTGGTGFVGAYILRELVEKGYRVRAIRHRSALPFYIPAAILDQVEWIDGDILDVPALEESMQDMDAVVHAAAKVSFSGRDRREMFHTNIEGTANVVNMALMLGIERLVYISSVGALGRSGNGELVTEEKKWEDSKRNTSYAISKYHGEMEVWRGIAEGLNASIVNPGTVLGYGDWNGSSCAIFKSAYREFPWYTNGVNGFVDVGDAARAVEGLLTAGLSGQRYILSGDNWSYRQLFDTIAKGFGKKRPTREAGPFLGGLAWRLEKLRSLISGRPSLLTRESARVAQSSTRYNSGKLLQALPGFRFTPLEETIEHACAAYMEHLQPL